MYSEDFMGEVKMRRRNAPPLSPEISRQAKSIIKVSPKIAIPGARLSSLNRVIPASGGILLLIKVITISMTIGKPRQKIQLSGSRTSSLKFRKANTKLFIL